MDKQEVQTSQVRVSALAKYWRWISYHEVPNGPVEDGPVVVTLLTQTDEILSSFGNLKEKTFRLKTDLMTSLCTLALFFSL